MSHLYVFMGKSAAGKDTLYEKIRSRNPQLRGVIPYTTRPIREGEKNGTNYYFVSEQTMHQMEEEGKVIECRCYQTVQGPWYYFTADDGQIDLDAADYAVISTLEGYEKIRQYFGADRVVPIYIEVPDFMRIERSLAREKQQTNPCVAEVCRRFLADEEDFSMEKRMALEITDPIANVDMDTAICNIENRMKK